MTLSIPHQNKALFLNSLNHCVVCNTVVLVSELMNSQKPAGLYCLFLYTFLKTETLYDQIYMETENMKFESLLDWTKLICKRIMFTVKFFLPYSNLQASSLRVRHDASALLFSSQCSREQVHAFFVSLSLVNSLYGLVLCLSFLHFCLTLSSFHPLL